MAAAHCTRWNSARKQHHDALQKQVSIAITPLMAYNISINPKGRVVMKSIEKVITASDLRDKEFGKRWGLTFTDGALEGLLSRAVVVTDASGKVTYTEQVDEVIHEPNYEKALVAVKGA